MPSVGDNLLRLIECSLESKTVSEVKIKGTERRSDIKYIGETEESSETGLLYI